MMRSNYLSAALLLGACVLAPPARAGDETNVPADPLPAEAVKLGDRFCSEVAKIAQQYAEAIKNLPSIQQTQLAALQKKLQKAGDLDGYLVVNKEIGRFTEALKAEPDPFEKIPELPASALVEKPDLLRALQEQYIKAHKDKSDVRDKRIEDLARSYIAQMESLKTDLTIKGRIRDAIAVKKEIERIRKGLEDKTFVPQALTAAPPSSRSVAFESAATNEVPISGKVPQ
jgi:hypothetical protein